MKLNIYSYENERNKEGSSRIFLTVCVDGVVVLAGGGGGCLT